MKRDVTFLFPLFLFLLVLPGCVGRLVDWGKEKVDQGTNIKENVKVARKYIRSDRIYDQFTLVGAFDSLWLSDDVRAMYAQLYALKHGKIEEATKLSLRRQLEENNHFISFYVLSVSDVEIGEKDSDWALFLKINENNFVPIELKKVDLCPEYELIFGKKLNRFKTAYIVRFNAKDIENAPLMQSSSQAISLVFRTLKKEVVQEWNIGEVDREEEYAKEVVA